MDISTKYDITQEVFLKTDSEQLPRIITEITVKPIGHMYQLSNGTIFSWHYEFEISEEKNVLLACGIEQKTTEN